MNYTRFMSQIMRFMSQSIKVDNNTVISQSTFMPKSLLDKSTIEIPSHFPCVRPH